MQQVKECSGKEYLKINVVGFCRRYWRGEKTEDVGIHLTGISLLLTQIEVMRPLTVLEVRRGK